MFKTLTIIHAILMGALLVLVGLAISFMLPFFDNSYSEITSQDGTRKAVLYDTGDHFEPYYWHYTVINLQTGKKTILPGCGNDGYAKYKLIRWIGNDKFEVEAKWDKEGPTKLVLVDTRNPKTPCEFSTSEELRKQGVQIGMSEEILRNHVIIQKPKRKINEP